jgi:cobalamin biosynthesis protein CbiD
MQAASAAAAAAAAATTHSINGDFTQLIKIHENTERL